MQASTELANGSTNIYSQSLRFYGPAHGTTPLYTGNISEWSTTTAGYQTNTYGFGYDKLGRLRSTDLYAGAATTLTVAFTERGITYDMNGNIKTLQRYTQSTASPADSYTYSYEGNALASISGTDNNASISGVQYSYDANGNMIHDGLKNFELSYNLLNLPSVVSQAGNEKATYSWFADGSKYRVLDESNNGYYYIGSLIYTSNNGNLQIESTDFAGGRINLVENTINNTLSQDIQYHHTDHLGSVRAITNQSGETVEQNAYYPFGSRHTFGNTYAQTTNRFKFNGKEEQTTGNLQYLDYDARMSDSKVARWFVQDPLSEKYYAQSQYNYCGGNPISTIDVEGAYLETLWDVASLVIGVKNLINNISQGNTKEALKDAGGIIVDCAAALLPVVPGGAGAALSTARAASNIVDAANDYNKIDNAVDAGRGVRNADVKDAKKFNGNHDTNSTTSKDAFRNAKDQNGIPRSQQPDKIIKPNTPEGNNYRLDDRNVKIYEFTNSKGESVLIRQDKSVNYGDGYQPEHFNAGLKQDKKLKQHHNYGL